MFILTKISLSMSFIMIIAMVTEYFGILDKDHFRLIALVWFSVQIVLLILFIAILIIKYRMTKTLNNGVKIIRHKFEDTCIKGQTDILPKSMSTTNPRKPSIFEIYVEVKDFKEIPDFGVILSGKGRSSIDNMKSRVTNMATEVKDSLFVFHADIIIGPNENINFQFRTDANIKMFFLGEIYIP